MAQEGGQGFTFGDFSLGGLFHEYKPEELKEAEQAQHRILTGIFELPVYTLCSSNH